MLRRKKMENMDTVTELELKKLMVCNIDRLKEKNSTKMEIENSKMRWGFLIAMNDYVCGSPDPEKFAQTMEAAGFRNDWPLSERETAIIRLAIKHTFLMQRGPRTQWGFITQTILNAFIAVYHSGREQQEKKLST
jgi:hypothetical protein